MEKVTGTGGPEKVVLVACKRLCNWTCLDQEYRLEEEHDDGGP